MLLANKVVINILVELSKSDYNAGKDLCKVIDAHYYTILEYLKVLERLGLVCIKRDEHVPRMKNIKLTTEGKELSMIVQEALTKYSAAVRYEKKNHGL